MAIVRWSEWYEVGVSNIDVQHQEIFATVNRLHALAAGGEPPVRVLSTLDFLILYNQVHFAEEEALMVAFADPNLVEHRREHADLMSQLQRLRESYASDPGRISEEELAYMLIEWLTQHIITTDAKMGGHIQTVHASATFTPQWATS